MSILPGRSMAYLSAFAPLFYQRSWERASTLLVGAILAPGARTITSILRVLGCDQDRSFQAYHRVLNRVQWSELAAGRILLHLLIHAFAPTGPLVVGVDETLERRRGPKIAAAGIYRDPVRSSKGHFVKVRALRWVCVMLLVPIPWAERTWALPFLAALAPSERYDHEQGHRHKALTDWARQLVRLVHRWYPDRALVVVGDSGYAALDFLAATRTAATVVTRLRLDARLFAPPPPRRPGQKGRPRVKGERFPTLAQRAAAPDTPWQPLQVPVWYGERNRVLQIVSDTAVWHHPGAPIVPLRWVLIRDPQGAFPTQALLCTDLNVAPAQIIAWFVQRWQMESTFHAARAHLGMETGRGWTERTIRRTTPVLLGLFSLVTLLAHDYLQDVPQALVVRRAAWYPKCTPTFSDALALVRRHLWTQVTFATSPTDTEVPKVRPALADHLCDLLCYAA
jgi:DDE superfamily endonuclease